MSEPDIAQSVASVPGRSNAELDPIRVLHVTEAGVGGIRTYLAGLLPGQVARGHDVHILASANLPGWTTYGLPRWEGVQHRPWSLDRSRPVTLGRALSELRRAVGEIRPDVVHLHSSVAGLLGRLPILSGTGRVARVYQPHAWSFEMFDNVGFRQAMRGWERAGSRRTDVLVTNGTDEVEEGRRVGIEGPACVIGVPLDTARFSPAADLDRSRARAELGINAPKMVVCVGRIAHQKGQDQLVSAWEKSPIPGTALVLVGGGDPESLRALAPTEWGCSIHAVGEHPDVRPWLWAADLLVLPSRYEGLSVVTAEALSSGLPVVATRANGVAAAVIDGPLPAAGAVVPLGHMRALIDACATRLSDRDLWASESANAQERAAALFRSEAVVDRLDAAYHRAVQERAVRERAVR